MRGLLCFFKSFFGSVSTSNQGDSKVIDVADESKELSSPEGLKVIAAVGSKKSQRPNFFDTTADFQEVPEPVAKFIKCGHSSSPHAKVNFWGRKFDLNVKDEFIKDENSIKTVEAICPKCRFEMIRDASIRCCLCGYGIIPEEGVALYHKSSKGINEQVATFVGDSVVGCLLWDCCPSGGFFAGHWTFEGFKSAFEGRTLAEQAMSTEQTVISNS